MFGFDVRFFVMPYRHTNVRDTRKTCWGDYISPSPPAGFTPAGIQRGIQVGIHAVYKKPGGIQSGVQKGQERRQR